MRSFLALFILSALIAEPAVAQSITYAQEHPVYGPTLSDNQPDATPTEGSILRARPIFNSPSTLDMVQGYGISIQRVGTIQFDQKNRKVNNTESWAVEAKILGSPLYAGYNGEVAGVGIGFAW